MSSALKYELSKEQKESYYKNGYLVASAVFSDDESGTILNRLYMHANKDFAAILNPDRPEYLIAQIAQDFPAHYPLGKRVDCIEEAAETSKIMRNVMKDSRIVSILETLQGKEVVGLQSQILFKQAGSPYASQAWEPHQDNSYIKSQGHYITTNLFLQDADKENGTLYFYPGSHKEGLFPAEERKSYRENTGTNPGNVAQMPVGKYEKVDVNFKKGDLLVLHGNCVHGSYPNVSETRSRPLFSCSYITKGEEFFSGATARRKVIPLH